MDEHMIREMQEEDNSEYLDETLERLEENRAWLSARGLTESDVMADDAGEYVYVENEDGLKKTYLPYANDIDLIF